MTRTLACCLVLLAGLWLSPDPVHARPDDAEHALDALLLRWSERPDTALPTVTADAPDTRTLPPTWRLYALARAELERGDSVQARTRWADLPPQSAEALLLQSLQRHQDAERPTTPSTQRTLLLREASSLADQALQGFDARCAPAPQPTEQQPAAPCAKRLRLDALRWRARLHRQATEYQRAQALLERALLDAQAAGWQAAEVLLVTEWVDIALRRKETDTASTRLADVQSVAAQTHPQSLGLLARVRLYQALLARHLGDQGLLRQRLEEAEQLALQAGAARTLAVVRNNQADAALLAGDPARALQAAQAGLDSPPGVLQSATLLRSLRHNQVMALMALGRLGEARAVLAHPDLAPTQNPLVRAPELEELAAAWAKVGQWRDALQLARQAHALRAALETQERESALAEQESLLRAADEEARLELLRRTQQIQQRTSDNQSALAQIGRAGGLLLALLIVLGALLGWQSRSAQRRLRRNQERLRTLSEVDALTHLANRRAFQAAMAARPAGSPFDGSLLLIDIDHFKRINDTLGHGAGDQVIQAVGQRLAATLREGDLLVRWGGEEFLLHAPGLGHSQLAPLAERLLRAVALRPVVLDQGERVAVSISLGAASFPLPPHRVEMDWERALAWVDQALYLAKARGRNRAVLVGQLHATEPTALALAESDLGGADAAGRVQLNTLVGPSSDAPPP